MPEKILEKILEDGFAALGLTLDEKAEARYRLYYERLEEANRVMNLTALSGEEDVARLHFLDSAAVLTAADCAGKRVIDVGTGAGFPGLAVKTVCPEMKLTLLDSLDKRVNFLRDTCAALDFDDVECIHARAEETGNKYREKFDVALSRAVARLNILCELCLPYVRPGGEFIAMKGPGCADEVKEAESAAAALGARVECVKLYTVPGTEIEHSLVIIKKLSPTPKGYPRRWAQIKKHPL